MLNTCALLAALTNKQTQCLTFRHGFHHVASIAADKNAMARLLLCDMWGRNEVRHIEGIRLLTGSLGVALNSDISPLADD